MKIPEHDIIEVKWLIARATFAAKPREEERSVAAESLFEELIELNELHGIQIATADNGIRIAVPGGATAHVAYARGEFTITTPVRSEKARIAYDAGLRSFVGPELPDAPPGRNGNRPRVSAMVALMRAALGDSCRIAI